MSYLLELEKRGKPKIKRYDIGYLIQLLGLIGCVGGVICEVVTGAALGYIIITGGSIIFAVGTKVKYAKG